VAESEDAPVLGAGARKGLRVRVPPLAQTLLDENFVTCCEVTLCETYVQVT
jgi:hypothetical protein